jgi:hypothetical protein
LIYKVLSSNKYNKYLQVERNFGSLPPPLPCTI